jgi:lipoprotein-anchoring transpeptidase ErfK/SrfK
LQLVKRRKQNAFCQIIAAWDEKQLSYATEGGDVTSLQELVVIIGVVMRSKFALTSATFVACLVVTPALAIEQTEKKPTKLAALSVEKTEAVVSSQPRAAKKKPVRKRTPERLVAKINLSTQTMNVVVDGRVKHSWKISSGARGYHTPTGSYKPYYITSMHYSKKYDNAPMPHSVFFRGGYAIHATSSIRRLGSPASHGCIRLHPSNARKFFKLVQRYKKAGTRVRITGATPATKARKRYARNNRRTRRSTSWSRYSDWGNSYTRSYRRRPANTRRVRLFSSSNSYRRTSSRRGVNSWQF